jgi:hypothetical protein
MKPKSVLDRGLRLGQQLGIVNLESGESEDDDRAESESSPIGLFDALRGGFRSYAAATPIGEQALNLQSVSEV